LPDVRSVQSIPLGFRWGDEAARLTRRPGEIGGSRRRSAARCADQRVLQQTGMPFIITQQVQPAPIICIIQSQHAWIILQQSASPLVQVIFIPSSIISHLPMAIAMLQQHIIIPFIIMQQLIMLPAIMLTRL
jgi:hypothetical protein